MKDVWFKEDRALAKNDKSKSLSEHKSQTEKVLRNSTLFRDRLERILQDMLVQTLNDDEDFTKPTWEREHVANISRRKTINEVLSLIDFKEDKTNVR